MRRILSRTFLIALAAITISGDAQGQQTRTEKRPPGVYENEQRVKAWNRFADSVHALLLHQAKGRPVTTAERIGGYSRQPNFYREITYTDAATGKVMGVVQYETASPGRLHTVEVFIRDKQGRIIRDYFARYMNRFRNAPIQTLINFHGYGDGMHGFRQFNASGEREYENCSGTFFGKPVAIEIFDGEFPPPPEMTASPAYLACFGYLSPTAGRYLDPLVEAPDDKAKGPANQGSPVTSDLDMDRVLKGLDRLIAMLPQQADLYVKRGDANFMSRNFDAAIADFTRAIELDDTQDKAYFGRGMVLARNGQITEGIRDLDVYIKRHPDDSVAYTKRGVRHIWNGDHKSAETDLARAIEINPDNAEAHDDIGVVKAMRGALADAARHFQTTLRLDPGYQKAYHNLSMVHYMTGDNAAALTAVDRSLKLRPQGRDSMSLKANILEAMGKLEAARAIRDDASFLPEGNRSERQSLR